MELKKPNFENVRDLTLGQEPVTVKSGIIIETGSSNSVNRNSERSDEVFISPVSILACLYQSKSTELTQLNSDKASKQAMSYLAILDQLS